MYPPKHLQNDQWRQFIYLVAKMRIETEPPKPKRKRRKRQQAK